MANVLVIDDDTALLRALRVGLAAGGHEVLTAVTGEQGISEVAIASPEVVVLDLGLADIDGLTVCRRIRQWSDVPIIVLSANDEESRKVAALNEGADDYMTKPFGMAELEARIRTAIRHHSSPSDTNPAAEVIAGPLHLDLVHREARLNDQPLELTGKEFDLLAFLARHVGKVSTHQMILNAVWGTAYGREAQYLHTFVHRIRQKLGDGAGVSIKTSPGIGYMLVANGG